MHILFYGYGSHAKKLKTCCEDYFKSKSKILFSGIRRSSVNTDINMFDSLEEVCKLNAEINCVFIAANNNYHLDIFKKCLKKKIKFIYIEKPALGVQSFFEKCPSNLKKEIKYVQIGYHMAYAEAFLKLKKIINNKKLGELIRLDLFSGHGLAFKSDFKRSWRANEQYALLETVLSHLINLSLNLTGADNIYNLNTSSRLNEINKIKDTEHITYNNREGALFSLTASWGSPLERTVKAYFSNGIWEYDFNDIVIKFPRDTFDSNNLFTQPKCHLENCKFNGLKSSVNYFLEQVTKNKPRKHEFNNSELTNFIMNDTKNLLINRKTLKK